MSDSSYEGVYSDIYIYNGKDVVTVVRKDLRNPNHLTGVRSMIKFAMSTALAQEMDLRMEFYPSDMGALLQEMRKELKKGEHYKKNILFVYGEVSDGTTLRYDYKESYGENGVLNGIKLAIQQGNSVVLKPIDVFALLDTQYPIFRN
jgi:hypothetical protein